MRQPPRAIALGFVGGVAAWATCAAAVQGEEPQWLRTVRSPAECLHILKLPAETCARVMASAWLRYRREVPVYVSPAQCWLNHDVCVVVQSHRVRADGDGGRFQPVIHFGPPLSAVRIRLDQEDAPPEILVDRGMVEVGRPRPTPIPEAGRFTPPQGQLRAAYLDAYVNAQKLGRVAAGGATEGPSRRPETYSDFSPVATYPVPKSKMQALRRAMRR